MTTSKPYSHSGEKGNKMSDEELKKEVLTQIRLVKYGNTPSNLSSEQLARVAFASSDMYQLIKQHREAYALELIGDDEPQSENGLLPDRVDRRNQLRAELREKVGRDDTK